MVSELDLVERACAGSLVGAPLGADDATVLAPLFKALGDPVRLRLVSLIANHDGGEACVCDLTDAFDLTAPTISHHLKVLRNAGLVSAERRGTWIYYRLNPAAIEQLSTITRGDQGAPA